MENLFQKNGNTQFTSNKFKKMKNTALNNYFDEAKRWKIELLLLRSIVLECGLTEELKWKQPCYTFQGKNICLIGSFKGFSALLFFKGALLDNSHKLLVKAGENSQAGRQIRFTNPTEIKEQIAIIKAVIFEAIEVEKAGLKIESNIKNELILVDEFTSILNQNTDLKTAFKKLTPGRQKAYNLFFSAAKQSKTRIDRIEKYTQRILDGKGINDCTCGLSKRMPNCDGSHKLLASN